MQSPASAPGLQTQEQEARKSRAFPFSFPLRRLFSWVRAAPLRAESEGQGRCGLCPSCHHPSLRFLSLTLTHVSLQAFLLQTVDGKHQDLKYISPETVSRVVPFSRCIGDHLFWALVFPWGWAALCRPSGERGKALATSLTCWHQL